MVDHTLIDVPLANVYLDSPYYKGPCKVMCVSSPVHPLIIGNVRGARQMLPDPNWKAGDMPSWMFKEVPNRGETKKRDARKKPAQFKKNDNSATQDVKVQEGITEGMCVAGPCLTKPQVKKIDKIHPLKLKKLSQVSTVYKCPQICHRRYLKEGFYSEEML